MASQSPEEIEKKLTGQIASILSVDAAKIPPEAPLHSMGIDSMSFVEILVFIEKAFNLRLIESGLTKKDFHTVRALASRISREMVC